MNAKFVQAYILSLNKRMEILDINEIEIKRKKRIKL